MPHTTVIPDGSQDWSGGVDSNAVTTIASERTPNGLKRNQLAWGNNITVRDGPISPRAAYQYLGQIHDFKGLFQGWFAYEPFVGDPYLIVAISGQIYQVTCNAPIQVVNLSAKFGFSLPPTLDYYFFVQAEEYLVIQCGDLVTLPLIWNGATLRKSLGITTAVVAPGTPGVNEIPAAGPMTYYQGRLWYSQGRQRNAGDIVGGPSGAGTPGNRGAVLEVTECPLVIGGDGFSLPMQSDNVRVLTFNANINTQLGQGQLISGTRKTVTALVVPVTRADWIATTNNNQPQEFVIQLVNGPVNDRSVVKINGDLYYVSLEPGIRSLYTTIRNWTQPGNIQIDAQEVRLGQNNNRGLLRFVSGVFWDNRLLMSQLPQQTSQGVTCEAVAPLDFIPVSTLGGTLQPVWEGVREGPNILQFASADFGGLERAFACVVSSIDGAIELWELTQNGRLDLNRNGESRITWIAEFPAFTWGREDELKKLRKAEIGLDRVFGKVDITVEYRPDNDACWHLWHKFEFCSARNEQELDGRITYPPEEFGQCYRSSLGLPEPPVSCSPCGNKRPSNIAFQFQPRITVKGSCRIRRFVLWAEMLERALYDDIIC